MKNQNKNRAPYGTWVSKGLPTAALKRLAKLSVDFRITELKDITDIHAELFRDLLIQQGLILPVVKSTAVRQQLRWIHTTQCESALSRSHATQLRAAKAALESAI